MLSEEAQKLCLKTGEPIVQSMEYRYPHQGYERIDNQFLLGENILVCPVIEKGARTCKVVLPEGNGNTAMESYTMGEGDCRIRAAFCVAVF